MSAAEGSIQNGERLGEASRDFRSSMVAITWPERTRVPNTRTRSHFFSGFEKQPRAPAGKTQKARSRLKSRFFFFRPGTKGASERRIDLAGKRGSLPEVEY
jgi:hypothetical protein